MQFSINPASPTSDDPVRLTVTIPGGHPSTAYSSSITHQVYGSYISINVITTRSNEGAFLPVIMPAGGSVQVGRLMPGTYFVTANWYRSDTAGVPPTLRETGQFDFRVGFGETVSASINQAVLLAFTTEEGKTYQIYRSVDFESWTPHGARITGDGSKYRYYEPTDGGRGFFRVVVVP